MAWEWSDVGPMFSAMWNYHVTTIDGQPISVGQVVGGVIIFLVGYQVIKNITRQVERRFLARLEIDVSLRDTLSTFIFYTLLVFLAFFTLRLLHVPLTVFTVVGGALAIGVGFGSQNVMNNFISGLILMVERPLRVGDFVEIEGVKGTVQRIGARATSLCSSENNQFVVPNSTFLEHKLLNWNLTSNLVRASVKVGVAYGSPVREVETILKRCVEELGYQEASQEIMVYFSDFGSSSLDFEVTFWVRATRPLERRVVESQLRFAVDEAFRRAGISIPFPQRDMNFSSTQPLRVEVIQ